MTRLPDPTERELEILKVIWERGEATVREVYEALRDQIPIVQNTVQAFLRTMEEKGLVEHRTQGRTFIYRACLPRDDASRSLLSRVLDRVFDGAIDQLVASALSLRSPDPEEITRLRQLLEEKSREADGDR